MINQTKPKEPEWTILKLLKWSTSYFQSHKIDSPGLTSEILLAHALKTKRINLYLQYDKPLSELELASYKHLIKRRISHEPVAYITGSKEFWSLKLAVTRDVLIPRPDTECLVETALTLLPESNSNRYIFELGTGSGAISIALASERPQDIFFASDCSFNAVALARQNAEQNKINGNINFFCGDWLSPIRHDLPLFDMILSNPPYIPSSHIPSLQPEITLFEPGPALDGGADGLSAIRNILGASHKLLKTRAYLLLEIGYDQKSLVAEIIKQSGMYEETEFFKDYAGHYRVVKMRKKDCT